MSDLGESLAPAPAPAPTTTSSRFGSPQDRGHGLVDYSELDTTAPQGDSERAAHRLYEVLIGLWAPAIIEAADELELFSALRHHEASSAQVAATLGTDVQATGVLLEALHVYGLVERTQVGDSALYSMTQDVARCTDADGRFSLVGKFRHDRDRAWPAWRQLADTVRHGNLDEGALQANQISTRDYASLAGGISFWAPPLVRRLAAELRAEGWSGEGRILDVGCGAGEYVRLLLEQFEAATATGFDVPGIVELAEQAVKTSGAADRFTALAGDFWTDAWPQDQTLVVFGNIYHLLPREQAARLTELAAEAVADDGWVCIIDQIRQDGFDRQTPQDRFAVLFAASMMATGGGDTYAVSDYDAWLEPAGLSRVALLDGPMHRILVAKPVR